MVVLGPLTCAHTPGRVLSLVALAGLLITAGPKRARADATLSPVDGQAAGSLEVGTDLRHTRRSIDVMPNDGSDPFELQPIENRADLRARFWPTDWISVQLVQPVVLSRELTQEGRPMAVDKAGIGDLSIAGSAVAALGHLSLASSIQLDIPSGEDEISSDRFAAHTRITGARWFGTSTLFASTVYVAQQGNATADAADSLGVELGFVGRVGRLSLMPMAAAHRMGVLSDDREAPYWMSEASLTAQAAVSRSLTARLTGQVAMVPEHALGNGDRGRARDLRMVAGLVYMWELPSDRSARRTSPDPAAMTLHPVRIDGRLPDARDKGATTGLMPRLRLATVAAERKLGGASGSMLVVLERQASGPPEVQVVDDEVGAPQLAHAIARFFRDTPLPDDLSAAHRMELRVCFERC